MNDFDIEYLLIEIYKYWLNNNFITNISNMNAESILKRQEIFNNTKEFVKDYLKKEHKYEE